VADEYVFKSEVHWRTYSHRHWD